MGLQVSDIQKMEFSLGYDLWESSMLTLVRTEDGFKAQMKGVSMKEGGPYKEQALSTDEGEAILRAILEDAQVEQWLPQHSLKGIHVADRYSWFLNLKDGSGRDLVSSTGSNAEPDWKYFAAALAAARTVYSSFGRQVDQLADCE